MREEYEGGLVENSLVKEINGYRVKVECPICGEVYEYNLLSYENPKCPNNHILKKENLIPDFLTKKYNFYTTEDKDLNLYLYDKEKGVWSDEKAKAIIHKEVVNILNSAYQKETHNKIVEIIKGKTINKRVVNSTYFINEEENCVYVNFKNCVVKYDLANKKVETLPHDPNFYFHGFIHVDFKKLDMSDKRNYPWRWLKLLWYYADGDVKKFIDLVESFSYAFCPFSLKKFIVFVGVPDTGKTTLLNLLIDIIGNENVSNLSLQDYSNASNRTFILNAVYGKTLNVCDDIPKNKVKELSVIKMITGNSLLRAERKFGDMYTFTTQIKNYFSANYIPKVPMDVAFFERLKIIEFNKVISNTERLNKVEISNYFDNEEKNKIVNFIYYFVIPMMLEDGFTISEDYKEIKREYYKNVNTSLYFALTFLEEDIEEKVEKSEVYNAYKDFCEKNKLNVESAERFWRAVKEVFPDTYITKERVGEDIIRYAKGITINHDKLNNSEKKEDKEKEMMLLNKILAKYDFINIFKGKVKNPLKKKKKFENIFEMDIPFTFDFTNFEKLELEKIKKRDKRNKSMDKKESVKRVLVKEWHSVIMDFEEIGKRIKEQYNIEMSRDEIEENINKMLENGELWFDPNGKRFCAIA
jgi:P4 family phage/plasmid primase-like protien